MDIEGIYNAYLKQLDALWEREENVFHASTAGSCYRKQLYAYYDFKSDAKDDKSLRLLRLGTIVHKDVEEALIKYEDTLADLSMVNMYSTLDDAPMKRSVYSEKKVKIKDLNIVGTFDAGEKVEYGNNVEFNLYDLKTAAAYKWTTKFGRKENRKPDSDTNYKLQLGTYALAVRHKYQPDKINMYLIWYNKNTSQMREQLVSNQWIDEALSYWTELNEIKDEVGKSFEDELIPNTTVGVPFQDWECRYCQYYDTCPSTLADKKKRY